MGKCILLKCLNKMNRVGKGTVRSVTSPKPMVKHLKFRKAAYLLKCKIFVEAIHIQCNLEF